MINGLKILAHVTARGGSKRIVDKNIKEINGHPLLAYSIMEAKKSKYVDKVILDTDSEEYAEIGKKYGAEIPYMRPKELATDTAKAMDVTIHAINWFKEHNEPFDILVKLQPTTPLRLAEDIDNALKIFIEKGADSIVSVTEAYVPPLWVNTLPEDHNMKDFIQDLSKIQLNTQELKKYYQLNGVVFLAKCDHLLKTHSWYGKKAYAYIMPRERSIDIDEPIDFEIAELYLKKRSN